MCFFKSASNVWSGAPWLFWSTKSILLLSDFAPFEFSDFLERVSKLECELPASSWSFFFWFQNEFSSILSNEVGIFTSGSFRRTFSLLDEMSTLNAYEGLYGRDVSGVKPAIELTCFDFMDLTIEFEMESLSKFWTYKECCYMVYFSNSCWLTSSLLMRYLIKLSIPSASAFWCRCFCSISDRDWVRCLLQFAIILTIKPSESPL